MRQDHFPGPRVLQVPVILVLKTGSAQRCSARYAQDWPGASVVVHHLELGQLARGALTGWGVACIVVVGIGETQLAF